MTKDSQLFEGLTATLSAGQAKFWLATSYSEFWYRDAVKEAQGSDGHATRREIVFSACFLESYIFEWTRTIVGLAQLDTYFPPQKSRNLKQKWKRIPIELFDNKIIPNKPDLDLSELGTLHKYRNGLVHAGASRPFRVDSPDYGEPVFKKENPIPGIHELHDKIQNGWAIGVAVKLVQKLHHDIGTPCPEYIH